MKKIYTLFLCLCMITTLQAQVGSTATGITVAGGNGVGEALNQVITNSIMLDPAGNLYVGDNYYQNRILKFPPGASDGIIIPGGSGAFTIDAASNIYIGNNGTVKKWAPGAVAGVIVANTTNVDLRGLAIDAAGNLYALDFYGSRVLKYTPGSLNGVTVMSTSSGLTASGVTTGFPRAFFVDPGGNIYIVDDFNGRILKFSPATGTTIIVAGGNGVGGAANQLSSPYGVFVDATGSIYVADLNNHRIQKWITGATTGVTVAGGNGSGSASNQLSGPNGVYLDPAGNIFVADGGNQRVQKFSVPTAQGSSAIGVTVAGGNGVGTALNQVGPTDVIVDAANNVYAVDNNNYRVLKFAPNAQQGVLVAGGNGNGPAANQLGAPHGITLDAENNLIVADYSNQRIQKWAPGSTAGTLVVAIPNATPQSVIFDAAGNIYVLDFYNTKILKYTAGSSTAQVLATSTELSTSNVSTNFPEDMVMDAAGSFYVIDRFNQRVVKWTPGMSSSIVVAGGNGGGTAANQLDYPSGIFVDAAGNLFIADTHNNRIQKWTPGAIAGITVAGGNGAGAGDTQLSSPGAVFVDAYGNIYVGDGANSRVQKFGDKSGGLYYKYYEGSFNLLPEFTTLAPVKTGISPNVDISFRIPGRNDNFAFLWEGRIKIPTAGNYTFETVSDDGSRLYFNAQYSAGATPTVNNDGVHAPTSVLATVNVTAAGVYPIAISYFEKDAGQTIQVYWSGPGIARQLIPDSAFVSSVGGDNAPPGVPANIHVVSKGGNYIGLDWDNSTDNIGVTGYNVYIDGVKRFSTAASELLATGLSPNTSYTFTVKAIDFAGNVSGFSIPVTESTSASSAGLTYKYYEGTWNTLPDFTLLTPVKTGTTPNVDISVRTTGRNDNFAFVWEGYITITTPGSYTFETFSDDGSKLYFNSLYVPTATATVNNDNLHAAKSALGYVNIAAAGVYPITITYFEKDGGENMQVYWQGPGIQRQQIPDAVFVQSGEQGSNLHYKYYEGTSWTSLPDFSQLAPVRTGKTSTVDIGIRPTGVNDNFGFVWEGYINIPVPGNYTFETVSDDGSKLYFNSLYYQSATPLVSNDGQHAPTSATGTVYVPTAGAYPIAITYFEKDGGESMQVYWSGPGFVKQLIPASAFVASPTQSSGINYKYYEGSWTTLPDFNALSPVKTGNTTGFDIAVRPAGVNDNFGFVWQGSINIPAAGNYTFETISDDGSKLYFNSLYSASATPLVNNDGLHAATSATGTVYIPAAGSYPLTVTFFEKDGGESMQVYWSGPGIPRQLIPASAFVQPVPALATASNATGESVLAGIANVDTNNGKTRISKVYPSPFVDRFKVEFYNSSSANNVSISVRDINGRLIYTQRAGNLVVGNNSINVSLNGAKLSGNVYMVTLHVNGKIVKTVSLLRAAR